MVTTACNAATMPVIGPYLDELQKWLSAEGFGGAVLMMLSNGGVVSADDAARAPIRLVESGPAAGALAGSWFAKRLGGGEPTGVYDRLLCFDMGGTTAKACLVEHGEPTLTTSFEVARIYRFKKGSGFPVSVPSIDLVEIGAGGGSIAHTDQFGLLKVGPESAGAEPGPAVVRPWRHTAGGHRRRRRARTARSGRLPRRRHAPRRRRLRQTAVANGRRSTRPRRPCKRPPASTRSSTRTWRPRRGCTPLSTGSTCAASPCWRSAAPGRSTPAASPNCSTPTGSSSRSTPVSCRPSARWSRRFASTSPARCRAASTRSTPSSAMRCSTSCATRDAASSPPPERRPTTCASATASTPATPARATRSPCWIGEGPDWPATDAAVTTAFENEYRQIFGMTIPDVAVEVVTWRLSVTADTGHVEPALGATGSGAEPFTRRPVVFERNRDRGRHAGVPPSRPRRRGDVRRTGDRRGTGDDSRDPARLVRHRGRRRQPDRPAW